MFFFSGFSINQSIIRMYSRARNHVKKSIDFYSICINSSAWPSRKSSFNNFFFFIHNRKNIVCVHAPEWNMMNAYLNNPHQDEENGERSMPLDLYHIIRNIVRMLFCLCVYGFEGFMSIKKRFIKLFFYVINHKFMRKMFFYSNLVISSWELRDSSSGLDWNVFIAN